MNIPIIHSRRMMKAIDEYNCEHGVRSDSDALSGTVHHILYDVDSE